MPIWPLPQHVSAIGDVQPLTLLGLLTDPQRDWFAGPMLLLLVEGLRVGRCGPSTGGCASRCCD